MKNKYIILIVLSILFYLPSALSQDETETCGTIEKTEDEMILLPWYGNNAFLDQFQGSIDSLLNIDGDSNSNSFGPESGNNINCATLDNHLFIPIRFWIYRETETEVGLPSQRQLQFMMDELNRLYQSNGIQVRFYMVCPQIITDADKVDMTPGESWTNQLGGNRTDVFAVNVHLVREYDGDDESGVYNIPGDFIVVTRHVYASTQGLTTLAHEIGHFFSLEHTHRNSDKGKCRQEAVSRTRKFKGKQFFGCFPPKWGTICEKSGDGFCDTPADPKLSGKVNSSCIYTTGETDNWGDAYVPDENNIMSYARKSCRNNFSIGQGAAIYYTMFYGRGSKFQLIDTNETDPDQYEPDDSDLPGVPRIISMGESQCHSIHNVSECQDEVDWLAIDNSNGIIGSYLIELDEISGFTFPVDDIKVWNTNNGTRVRTTEVTTTKTTNGTIETWEVACSDAASELLLIEVIAKDEEEEGKYTLTLNSSIQLPKIWEQSQICIDDEVSISFLPSGASVSWTSSSNITLSSNTGTSTTITGATNNNQDFELNAIVSHQGCTYTIVNSFDEIGANTLPQIGSITMNVSGPPCEPHFTFSIPDVAGATNYQWECSSSPLGYFNGCYGGDETVAYGEAVIEDGTQISLFITVKTTNDCGVVSTKSQGFIYQPDGICDFQLQGGGNSSFVIQLSPNPVEFGQLTVEIEDDEFDFNSSSYDLYIINQFGEVKYNQQIDQLEKQIDVSNLPTGIYALLAISGETVLSENFVIQN
jgi:hypothetical protein